MANNFKCNNCNQTFFVSVHKHGFIRGQYMLIGEYQCYHCKSYDTEEIPKPQIDYSKGAPAYGKFSSASDEKKREILTKRANAHYNQKGKEQKREFFKNTMRKMSQ